MNESTRYLKYICGQKLQLPSPSIIELLLTVKAVTLIFISGHGSAISSAKEGQSDPIYNLAMS